VTVFTKGQADLRGHVAGVWDNDRVERDLLVHLLGKRGVTLIMVAGDDEGGNFDGRQFRHVFDAAQVAIDDKLPMGAPHLAIEQPRGSRVLRCGS